MLELRDARATIKQRLKELHIRAFVYEQDDSGADANIIDRSLDEIARSHVYLVVFSESLGEGTLQEYDYACSLGISKLIYVRREAKRQEELSRFLEQNLGNPLSPGYAYFDHGVDLAERIGKDIQVLLARAYLASDRKLPRTLVPRSTRLAWDVIGWYRAIEYAEPEQPQPVAVDLRTVDCSLRVIQKRIGFARAPEIMVVRCIQGLVSMQDAQAFARHLSLQHADYGQIISDVGIEAPAKRWCTQQPNLTAMTFDELLDESVQFERYFDELERYVLRQGIDSRYRTLACKRKINGTGNNPAQEELFTDGDGGIDDYVLQWLRDPDKEHLSVLGQFGTGKTWFTYHFAWLCLKAYREAKRRNEPRPRIPIVIPLREYVKAVSIESLFSEFFFRSHNLGITTYEAFRQLNRMGKLLLLFDGFDEMATKVDRLTTSNAFWQLARVLVPGGKAVLTCRTEHFTDARESRELLTPELRRSTANVPVGAPQFEVVELEMFSKAQVRDVLEAANVDAALQTALLERDELFDVVRRPLLLGLVLEVLPAVQDIHQVDIARVYLHIVKRKMAQEIATGRAFISLSDKLYFLCELSWEMLRRNEFQLNFRDFPSRLQALFGSRVGAQKDLDHWQRDLLRSTMLVRNDEGDYSMAHRSFVEYFVAYKLIAELGVMHADFISLAQASTDATLPAQTISWFEYFAPATQRTSLRLHKFAADENVASQDSTCAVHIDRLTPNAVHFAAHMVSLDAGGLDALCDLAATGSGRLAWNALYLLPYLKETHAVRISELLVGALTNEPLRNGVCWLLGELGVSSPAVLSALKRTVELFRDGCHSNAHAWWESGFALEKLGGLEDLNVSAKSGAAPIAYLAEHLPANSSLESALERLKATIAAPDQHGATVNQADFVVIAKHESACNKAALYADLLSQLDFSSDSGTGKRLYYVVWLCGHLEIRESIPNLVKASRHPHASVRNCACEALGKIGSHDETVAEALEERLGDGYFRARVHAASALRRIGSIRSIGVLKQRAALDEVKDVQQHLLSMAEQLAKLAASS
jgi:hypothetical protein